MKNVRFAGLGEPLLNKNIAQMIQKIKPYSETVTLFTNESLLAHELSEQLIASGLDILRISLQGYDAAGYKKMSDVNLDFKKLKNEIQYFYSIRKQCKVFIKMFSTSLDEQYTEQDFIDEFEPICDYLNIEEISPLFQNVNYTSLKINYDKSVMGYKENEFVICPQPFFQLTINASGTVSPCCNDPYEKLIIGNINCIDENDHFTNENKSIASIWNSLKMVELRLSVLKNEPLPTCKNCEFVKYGCTDADNLNDIRDKLIEHYENNKNKL